MKLSTTQFKRHIELWLKLLESNSDKIWNNMHLGCNNAAFWIWNKLSDIYVLLNADYGSLDEVNYSQKQQVRAKSSDFTRD